MWRYITMLTVLAVFVAIYWDRKSTNNDEKIKNKLFTSEEVAQYNGIKERGLYLVILGNVFDVTKGVKHYGPGKTYHVFVGHDASRCFITGKFAPEDISDDVTGLSSEELLSLKNWLDFYRKEYIEIGKLIGRYYDVNGEITQYGKEIQKLIKVTEAKALSDKQNEIDYPPCNIEWDKDKGTRLWCTNKSGGILRDWVGVPRKYYQPGQTSFRCACIKESDKNLANIQEYENCPPHENSCLVNID